jgi:hypothetical protein
VHCKGHFVPLIGTKDTVFAFDVYLCDKEAMAKTFAFF